MPDVLVEEKVVLRFSKLIKDTRSIPTGIRISTFDTLIYLRDSALEPIINDPEVTITSSIIPKDNLLNVNSI